MTAAAVKPDLLRDRFIPRFTVRDLVFIGVFAAVIKALSLLIAFMGGGMNPLTLGLKNFVYATMMIVLAYKIRKPWSLTLAAFVTNLVALLLMGQGIMHTPGALLACVVAELVIFGMGGYGKIMNIVVGVFLMEILSKVISLGFAWIGMREQPGMIIPVVLFVAIGSVGTFAGLFGGVRLVKELRHAAFLS